MSIMYKSVNAMARRRQQTDPIAPVAPTTMVFAFNFFPFSTLISPMRLTASAAAQSAPEAL